MKIVKFTLLFSLLAAILLAACQPAPPVDTPPVDEDYIYGQDAVVESVDVLLLESFPLQARAVVTGYLPDGCTELVKVNVDRQGNEFLLTLTTRRPAGDVVCTMVLQLIEETVTLDIEGLPAGTYTVIAQDQQAQFTLDVDNLISGGEHRPVAGSNGGVFTGSDAVVEEMSVMIMESYPVQVSVQLNGYLPDGCTTIRKAIASRDGNTFNIRITTQRPGSDVACTMALVPFEERISLEVDSLPAGQYTVQLGNQRETFTLDMAN